MIGINLKNTLNTFDGGSTVRDQMTDKCLVRLEV